MLNETQKFYLSEDEEVVAAWQECWENILRLPLEARLPDELFAEAEHLVCNCRSRTRDKAIAWLKEEIEDGQGYVAMQLAIDPEDAEWQCIQVHLRRVSRRAPCKSLISRKRVRKLA